MKRTQKPPNSETPSSFCLALLFGRFRLHSRDQAPQPSGCFACGTRFHSFLGSGDAATLLVIRVPPLDLAKQRLGAGGSAELGIGRVDGKL